MGVSIGVNESELDDQYYQSTFDKRQFDGSEMQNKRSMEAIIHVKKHPIIEKEPNIRKRVVHLKQDSLKSSVENFIESRNYL